ncbi:MAG: hypothetical protein V3T84_05140 [Phycisphaerales bacterium]
MYGTLSKAGLLIATSAGAVALSATMSYAGGIERIWIGLDGGSFHDELNWDPIGEPGRQDTAIFEETDAYAVIFSQSVANSLLIVDDGEASFELGFQSYQLNGAVVANHVGGLVRLTLLNGTVSVVSPGLFVRIGKDPGAVGELIVSTNAAVVSSETVLIGDAGLGTLVVSDGGSVSTAANTFLADDPGSTGTVIVDGPGSTWSNSGNLFVGNFGSGTLSVLDGGAVSCLGVTRIADDPGSTGSITIAGAGSTWSNSGNLFVGNFGSGTLSVLNGGSASYNSVTRIGDELGSDGSVFVSGIGSTLTMAGDLFIANFSSGSVSITNGGSFSTARVKVGDETGSIGTVTVEGPGSTWTDSIEIFVGNHGSGSLMITNGGTVSGVNGTIGDDPGSVGNVTITGAGSSLTCTTQLAVGGLGEGNLTVSDGAMATAPVVSINQQSSVDGDGVLAADVANDGTVGPGLSVGDLTIQGSYLQAASGRLEIELDSVGHDRLTVTEVAQLAGTLQLSLINGFRPKPGQEFIILTAGSVVGTFDEVVGPKELEVVYGAGIVTVVAAGGNPCPWDLDGSGSVGASDLLSLLVSWGPCKGCPADFDGNGTVGASDLLALLVNWGPCP